MQKRVQGPRPSHPTFGRTCQRRYSARVNDLPDKLAAEAARIGFASIGIAPATAAPQVYALGSDYHDIIKKRLKALAGWLVPRPAAR
jgi:epoxyqueuosine reductase QueG